MIGGVLAPPQVHREHLAALEAPAAANDGAPRESKMPKPPTGLMYRFVVTPVHVTPVPAFLRPSSPSPLRPFSGERVGTEVESVLLTESVSVLLTSCASDESGFRRELLTRASDESF
jgi:hypothetical protein